MVNSYQYSKPKKCMLWHVIKIKFNLYLVNTIHIRSHFQNKKVDYIFLQYDSSLAIFRFLFPTVPDYTVNIIDQKRLLSCGQYTHVKYRE